MIKVYVSVPSTGTVSDLHPFLYRELAEKYAGQVELVFPKVCTQRKFHDFARNAQVEDFLATDCDILWFLDSDVVPPSRILDLVTKYGDQWEVAGAPYPIFMTPAGYAGPQIVMTVYQQGPQGLHAAACPQEGKAFVDGLATGCLFIKREVIEKLTKPYFEFKYDAESRMMIEGEDLGFCLKVGALGYKFFTDYSMVCKHYKTVCLLEMNNYAIDQRNQAAEVVHTNLRDQAMVAVREAYERGKRAASDRTASGIILPK